MSVSMIVQRISNLAKQLATLDPEVDETEYGQIEAEIEDLEDELDAATNAHDRLDFI